LGQLCRVVVPVHPLFSLFSPSLVACCLLPSTRTVVAVLRVFIHTRSQRSVRTYSAFPARKHGKIHAYTRRIVRTNDGEWLRLVLCQGDLSFSLLLLHHVLYSCTPALHVFPPTVEVKGLVLASLATSLPSTVIFGCGVWLSHDDSERRRARM